VAWENCCLLKKLGGLKLLDLEVSFTTLLAKWILFVIGLGISNLKILLRYRIHRMKQHCECGFWFPTQAWLMVHKSLVTHGSWVWNRITNTWRHVVKHIESIPPSNLDKVLSTSL